MRKGAPVVALTAAVAACGAIVRFEPLEFTPAAPDAAEDGASLPEAQPEDAGVVVPFCTTVDARVCTDFSEEAGAGTLWRNALPNQEIVGMGVAPFVTSSPEYPERGPFLVAKFVPNDSGAAVGYHISNRGLFDPAPGWDGGLSPPRRYEFKMYVEQSDHVAWSSLLYMDPSMPLTVGLGCAEDAGPCQVFATRGAALLTLADIVVPPMTWTKVVVELPPSVQGDAAPLSPRQYDVTVDVPGRGPIKKTCFFNGDFPAPNGESIAFGLGRSNGDEGPWEVWYDDVAISY
jgi:hypothetical protein